jgi:hypothetical protein
MDAMKAGAARLEAATALTLATAPTAAADDGTAFMSAVAAFAGTTGGWQTSVVQGGRVPRASARVLTMKDVSFCETASSYAPRLGFPHLVRPGRWRASGRSVVRRRRGEHPETAALGLP